jgi:hypothetical protein
MGFSRQRSSRQTLPSFAIRRRIWENPELKVIIVFSLIAAFAALCVAIYFPLPEDIHSAPMNIT